MSALQSSLESRCREISPYALLPAPSAGPHRRCGYSSGLLCLTPLLSVRLLQNIDIHLKKNKEEKSRIYHCKLSDERAQFMAYAII